MITMNTNPIPSFTKDMGGYITKHYAGGVNIILPLGGITSVLDEALAKAARMGGYVSHHNGRFVTMVVGTCTITFDLLEEEANPTARDIHYMGM